MTTLQFKRPKLTWRRLLLGSLGAGAVAGAVWLGRRAAVPEAGAAPPPQAEPAAPSPQAAPPPASDMPSEYSERAVAYVYGSTRISREQLGEDLIARFGPDKVLNLVNKLIIERTCHDRGITVTDAEVDVALSDEISGMKVNPREFVEKVLREKHKSLYEWREDVLRPKLLMTKLLRDTAKVQDEVVQKAFESVYGERVYCQAIMWPLGEEEQLKDVYGTLIKDPVEFSRVARTRNSKAMLAVGGMLEPFGHHCLSDEAAEKIIFGMGEGEVTPVFRVEMIESGASREPVKTTYAAVVKVLKKFPPDPTKKLEDVRAALEKEIIERQIIAQMPSEMEKMQKAADPKIVLKPDLKDDDWVHAEGFKRVEVPFPEGLPRSQQPVAYIYGTTAVTREQLGEYLILRYGAERVGLMVNKYIVEKECAERGVTVSEAEIEAALENDIKISQAGSREKFIQEYLRANRTTLFGYREDVIRPKLLLAKLARAHVKVEPDDMQKAFEAYHGEKAECQIILWPRSPRDHEIAIKQYERIRKSPAEFDTAARTQASARLAATAGRIDPFGRHMSGSEDLEREVFALRPGEITPVVETPQGYVVARLVRRLPATPAPQDPAAAAAERARWEEEILKKKAEMQIPAEFAKLRDAAAPNLILRPMLREDDWLREVKQEISGVQPQTAPTAKR
jgi:hypothetical protein